MNCSPEAHDLRRVRKPYADLEAERRPALVTWKPVVSHRGLADLVPKAGVGIIRIRNRRGGNATHKK